MSDALRYRLVDEPRPSFLQKIALPPLLVFLVGQYFLPWGLLLVAVNAVALNGPHRNREIAFALIPILIFFASQILLGFSAHYGLISDSAARYLFVLAIGVGLMFIATAFVSQERTAALRQYLRQR
ncbi:hypothetical protein FHS96_004663 [Sphingomonas zeicaulis]|uniref:hypothetical protein n=1 Tax=Sphingomonas zeicaulis TaxID=1632740 RepID=UPI003D1CE0C1